MQTEREGDAHERGYEAGAKAAYRELLRSAIRNLGHDDPEANAERWRIERAETVAKLRSICERYGDNDWPDDLHLADVIEKHLWRHLPKET
jgi:hypothetical protein